jgi:hypothetical protein
MVIKDNRRKAPKYVVVEERGKSILVNQHNGMKVHVNHKASDEELKNVIRRMENNL